jgi:predicted lipoprotein with Yx(FWY)xxD motif
MLPAARTAHLLCAAAFATSLALAPVANAAPVNGTPLCTAAGDQLLPVTVSDGVGGIIVAWHDQRPTVPGNGVCYAQRLNAAGAPLWAADGVPLSMSGDVGGPVIASDGAGGAFVAYGGEFGAPRIQRVNASGVEQWGSDGVQLSTNAPTMRDLAIAPDVGGGGGAIVAWRQDNASGGFSDIFAQKVNSSGATQWGSPAIPITSTNTLNESVPSLLSDGAGGVFVTWHADGIRLQRYNSAGVSAWSALSLNPMGSQVPASMVSDGSGGVVVAWSVGTGALTQRVSSAGAKQWTPNAGVTLSSNGRAPTMIPDGSGGAIITWEDNRTTTNFDIYAQKMSSAGAAQWAMNGASVCVFTADQRAPQIVSDGAGGALISWYDDRMNPNSGYDIYAQRIDGTGAAQWTSNGAPLCTVHNDQEFPTMASDGAGGAWVAWQDFRTGTSQDIYASRVNPSGIVLAVPSGGASWTSRVWPDPFFDRVEMEFVAPAATKVHETVIDLQGRVVRDLGASSLSAGAHRLAWDGRASDGRPVGVGIYFLRVDAAEIAINQRVVRLR